MAQIGRAWADHSWDSTSWESTAWREKLVEIGQAWRDVWATDTWDSTAWFPALSETGGYLPEVQFVLRPLALTTAEVADEPVGGDTNTLPVVKFYMRPGSVLDLSKTLPIVDFVARPKALNWAYEGSVDAQTVEDVDFLMKSGQIVVGIVLPPISVKYAPQAFTDYGFTLPRVRVIFKPLFGAPNLSTNIKGRKSPEDKLVRKAVHTFKVGKTAAKAVRPKTDIATNVPTKKPDPKEYKED